MPLENISKYDVPGTNQGGREGGNGKNLHFQQFHVTVSRCPTSSLKYPILMVREGRRQALTLVRQFNATEFAPRSKGNRHSLGSCGWIVVRRVFMRAL